MRTSPPLRIDRRERPRDFVDLVRLVVGEDRTELALLPCADYAVGTALGVERKTAGNLVSSMTAKVASGEKELWDQLGRCQQQYGAVALLVEGRLEAALGDPRGCIADGRARKVPWLAVQGTLWKVQDQGIRVVQVRTKDETCLALKWLWEKYRRQ